MAELIPSYTYNFDKPKIKVRVEGWSDKVIEFFDMITDNLYNFIHDNEITADELMIFENFRESKLDSSFQYFYLQPYSLMGQAMSSFFKRELWFGDYSDEVVDLLYLRVLFPSGTARIKRKI